MSDLEHNAIERCIHKRRRMYTRSTLDADFLTALNTKNIIIIRSTFIKVSFLDGNISF